MKHIKKKILKHVKKPSINLTKNIYIKSIKNIKRHPYSIAASVIASLGISSGIWLLVRHFRGHHNS